MSSFVVNMQGVQGVNVLNHSGKDMTMYTDPDGGERIPIKAGEQVPLPDAGGRPWYFKNDDSGHELGPLLLALDIELIVAIDGILAGTIDVYVGAYVLGILQLVLKLLVSL